MAKQEESFKRVTVLLSSESHMKLKVFAAQQNMTMNDIMSDALELYLQQTAYT